MRKMVPLLVGCFVLFLGFASLPGMASLSSSDNGLQNASTSSNYRDIEHTRNIEHALEGAASAQVNTSNLWQQETFIISSFHPLAGGPKDLELMIKHKEAGFNLLEMTFVSRSVSESAVQYGQLVGINVLAGEASDPEGRFGGFQNVHIQNPTEEQILDAIASYGNANSLYGFYVWDEPEPVNFEETARQVALFKKHAPDKLAFVVAMPSYWDYFRGDAARYEKYWDDLAATVQPPIVSSNYYPFYHEIDRGVPLERSGVWRDLGYVRLKSIELDVPMWFYIQLSDDLVANNLGKMTIEKVRLQAYYAMAYGATGIQYYNTLEALLTVDAQPTAIYDDIKALNNEISALGTTLVPLKTTGIYHTGDIQAPYTDDITTLQWLAKAPNDIILGTFSEPETESEANHAHDKAAYWLIVNRSFTNALNDDLVFQTPLKVTEVSKVNGQDIPVGNGITQLSLNLRAGEGALYRVEPADIDSN